MSIYFTVGLDGLAAASQYLPGSTVIPGGQCERAGDGLAR